MRRHARAADEAWDDDGDDPDEIDEEGPSREDLRRFSRAAAHCPACGAEVYDDAVTCPECFEVIAGATSRRPPLQAWWRQRWLGVLVAILVLALLGILPILLRR